MKRWAVYGYYDQLAYEARCVGRYRLYWIAMIAAWWFRTTRPLRWWPWFWHPGAWSRATTLLVAERAET
jgi:hypothetical protein